MEILFYRYGSICEPDIIESFRALGLTVVEECTQIANKKTTAAETVDSLSELFKKHSFLFVFTVNFFPAVSEVCQIYQLPYVCWTVDCPVIELFSKSLQNSCNRIFLFDRAQYEYFKKFNPERTFHLPLATNTNRWDQVTAASRGTYSADISFVGSLYSEKNPCHRIRGLSDYAKGYMQGLKEAQLKLYGAYMIPEALSEEFMKEVTEKIPDLRQPLIEGQPEAARYLFAHSFMATDIAETERIRLLSLLSGHFDTHIYTYSDTSGIPGIHPHPGVKTLTEMPLVFHESRINLNITMRSIEKGLSLRIFDVCGAGGFLLCNYQEELFELYEPGTEVEFYSSPEELLDKADYYLSHEEERAAIAAAGYARTKSDHTYLRRISEMIRLINSTL